MNGRTGRTWVKFDRFRADLATGELFRGEKRLGIQEKPFRVLELLVRAQGSLVTRDQIFQAAWPDVHVERNRCLNSAVRKLRSVLSDNAANPRVIETIGSRGYRLLPKVEGIQEESDNRKPTLAILPFQNLSDDPGDEYFSDGLTEQIIAQIGRRYRHIGVIAPGSAMQYKGTAKKPPQIGRELNSDYVLCGTVLRSGAQLRITARLIRTEDQNCLWADIFARPANDVFAVQDDITDRIARSISESLPAPASYNSNLTTTPEIYEKYLRACFFAGKATQSGFGTAVDLFQQVIAEDSCFAPAYASLAIMCTMSSQYGPLSPSVLHGRVRMLASRALDLCPELPDAHSALAMTELLHEGDFEAAIAGFSRALEISPSSAFAHQGYSQVMSVLGRHQESIEAMERARKLDPLSPIVAVMVSCSHFFAGNLDIARDVISKALELHPNFPILQGTLGWILSQEGNHRRAIAASRSASDCTPGSSLFQIQLAHTLALAGEHEEARVLLKQVVESRRTAWVSSYCIALVHAALGELDSAFEWLEESAREGDGWRVIGAIDPRMQLLAQDPRFQRWLKRLGLAQDSSASSAS